MINNMSQVSVGWVVVVGGGGGGGGGVSLSSFKKTTDRLAHKLTHTQVTRPHWSELEGTFLEWEIHLNIPVIFRVTGFYNENYSSVFPVWGS